MSRAWASSHVSSVDDPQVGVLHRQDLVLGLGGRWGTRRVGPRDLDPLLLLEPPDARVALVVEHRPDGRAAPAEAPVPAAGARGGHTLEVQRAGDAEQRAAVVVVREDAPDEAVGVLVDLDPVADDVAQLVGLRLGAGSRTASRPWRSRASARPSSPRSVCRGASSRNASAIMLCMKENVILAFLLLVSIPSATLMSGTSANWSRLKIDAASAKSREMREMPSVTMTPTRPSLTARISASNPGRCRLAPDTAKSGKTCGACRVAARRRDQVLVALDLVLDAGLALQFAGEPGVD